MNRAKSLPSFYTWFKKNLGEKKTTLDIRLVNDGAPS